MNDNPTEDKSTKNNFAIILLRIDPSTNIARVPEMNNRIWDFIDGYIRDKSELEKVLSGITLGFYDITIILKSDNLKSISDFVIAIRKEEDISDSILETQTIVGVTTEKRPQEPETQDKQN